MADSGYHAIVAERYNSNTSSSYYLAQPTQSCPRRKPVPTYSRNDGSSYEGRTGPENEPDELLDEPTKLKGTRTLQPRICQSFFRVLVDVFLIVLPCLFIALAIIAVYLNGHPFSSYGQKVEQASRLGPTIFPIAFAAIVARFSRHLATWQAERGQRLGILEQLMQSQSLAGSVVAAYNLRTLSVTGFAIVLLWAFSPLGGQSSLRILSTSNALIESQSTIYGATPETTNYFGGAAEEVTTVNVINALFSAGLLGPDDVRNGPVDLWGNYKIPAAKYVSNLNSDTWYTVDANSNSVNYSSLVGVPTFGVPKQGTANFTIARPIFDTDCHWGPTGYTRLEWCLNISLRECTTSNNICLYGNRTCILNQTTGEVLGPFYYGPGLFDTSAWSGMNASNDASVNATQLKSTSPPQYIDITYSAVNSSKVNNITYEGLKAQCISRTTRVEAEVVCTDASCRVPRFRKSNDPRPDFINPWNDATVHQEAIQSKLLEFNAMLAFLPGATGATIFGYATPLDGFLNGISHPFSRYQIGKIYWQNVSEVDFSARLSLLFNTYWTISQWPSEISDHSNTNLSSLNATRHVGDFQVVTATVTEQYSVYKADYVWITILLVASMILLVCTLASLLLRVFTIAPDLLGYVSSLTRDSTYFEPLQPGGSVLSGEQRARQLRDMKVQIADVYPEAKVGHVAFVRAETLQGEKREYARLRKGRLYD